MSVFLHRCLLGLLFTIAFIGSSPCGAGESNEHGTLVLVGGVLPYNNLGVWEAIANLASLKFSDLSIIAAANQRPRLYAGFTKRGLERYGAQATVLPVAADSEQFGMAHQDAVNDSTLADRVRLAGGVFFVGGEPQTLSRLLLKADGSATALARSVTDVFNAGGLVVGGIPGSIGVRTGYDAMSALEAGRIADDGWYRGLGLIADGWYVDQHFFSHGRFAETIVAMCQLGMRLGLGIGVDTAAVVDAGQVEVVGRQGVMLIDLTDRVTCSEMHNGFRLKGARLSYLSHGDRLNMNTRGVTADTAQREDAEMRPSAKATRGNRRMPAVADGIFGHGRLVQLMNRVLQGGEKPAIDYAFRPDADMHDRGFRFHLYAGSDTVGWGAPDDDRAPLRILNVYLDISSVTRRDVEMPE